MGETRVNIDEGSFIYTCIYSTQCTQTRGKLAHLEHILQSCLPVHLVMEVVHSPWGTQHRSCDHILLPGQQLWDRPDPVLCDPLQLIVVPSEPMERDGGGREGAGYKAARSSHSIYISSIIIDQISLEHLNVSRPTSFWPCSAASCSGVPPRSSFSALAPCLMSHWSTAIWPSSKPNTSLIPNAAGQMAWETIIHDLQHSHI